MATDPATNRKPREACLAPEELAELAVLVLLASQPEVPQGPLQLSPTPGPRPSSSPPPFASRWSWVGGGAVRTVAITTTGLPAAATSLEPSVTCRFRAASLEGIARRP